METVERWCGMVGKMHNAEICVCRLLCWSVQLGNDFVKESPSVSIKGASGKVIVDDKGIKDCWRSTWRN